MKRGLKLTGNLILILFSTPFQLKQNLNIKVVLFLRSDNITKYLVKEGSEKLSLNSRKRNLIYKKGNIEFIKKMDF